MEFPGKGIYIEDQWWSREEILSQDDMPDSTVFYDAAVWPFLRSWFDDTPELTGFTSGSTGEPKKIELVKKYCWASAQSTISYFGIRSRGTALLSMPAKYIAGRMMIVRAIAGKLNLKMIPPSSSPELPEDKMSLTAFTPHQFGKMLDHPDAIRRSGAKVVLLGGAPVSRELVEKIYDSGFGGRVFETFGMTETYSHIAVKSLYPDRKDHFEAVPDVSFSTDEGQLVIHAPHIGRRHLATNDVVELLSPLKFKWIGRADFVVNSGGVKLFPERIEEKLAKFLENPFFLCGVPDGLLGERLILVIEEQAVVNKNEVLEICRKHLHRFEKPKEVFFVKKMHYTDSGKIDRQETLSKNHYFA